MARTDLSNYYAMKGWNVPAAGRQPTYTRQLAPTYSAGPDNSGNTMYATGTAGPSVGNDPNFMYYQPMAPNANGYSLTGNQGGGGKSVGNDPNFMYYQPMAPNANGYSLTGNQGGGGTDRSGNTMYALGGTATTQPPAFDWRLGAWMVANRWAPEWAAKNPYTSITDGKALSEALKGYAPEMKTPAYAAWNNDLKYLQAGLTNTAMPTWYNIKQPWGEVAPTPTPAPSTGYQPAPGVPNFNWANWGGQTATNPIGQYAGTPSWMNDPEWVTKPGMADQAQKWAAVMVPWAQAQQNAYQYQNDANEAQRRYNIDFGWRQAQDSFSMDQAQKAFDYQKERDKEEFGLARQQIWSRNVAPNVKWMRSWG